MKLSSAYVPATAPAAFRAIEKLAAGHGYRSIRHYCTAAHVCASTVYKWRERDGSYSHAIYQKLLAYGDSLAKRRKKQ